MRNPLRNASQAQSDMRWDSRASPNVAVMPAFCAQPRFPDFARQGSRMGWAMEEFM